MNYQLTRLIFDYQASVYAAVELMQRSGVPLPLTRIDWLDTDISTYGELDGGIRYFKHGYGCAVSLSTGKVDFDFGEQGEIGGFDVWRLASFAGSRLKDYGFDNVDALKEFFDAEVNTGSLISPGNSLYFVVGASRISAIEALNIQPTDTLPSPDQDSVLTLYAHYFLAADLMRSNYVKLHKKWSKPTPLSQDEKVNLGIYLCSWLGFLAVTCEGFKKLRMRLLLQDKRPQKFHELISKCNGIGKMMNRHADALREFRNNVFHLRDDAGAINRFFAYDAERLPWAVELHTSLGDFFSEYRVLCEVHYLLNDRRSESQLGRMRPKRRRINPS
ncbi:DUF6896 domain-containing protein [Pseudomonas jessenii]|uniref:DUF6896 domain-containing protein n=1 Tax=Pseudomonas jessenii TaxID=77298 RepID=UPI0032E4B55C